MLLSHPSPGHPLSARGVINIIVPCLAPGWPQGPGQTCCLVPGPQRGLWCAGASLASGVLEFKTVLKNLEVMSKKNNTKSGRLLEKLVRNKSTNPTDSWKLKLAKVNEVKQIFNRFFTKFTRCHWTSSLRRKAGSFPA